MTEEDIEKENCTPFIEGAPCVIPFGAEEVPEIGFSLDEWHKAYYNNNIHPDGNLYGYRIPTDDGSVFGSKVNAERIKNGLQPI